MSSPDSGFVPVDNVPVREAVAAFAASPDQSTYLDVIRATLQGSLLLDSTGSDRPVVDSDGNYSFPPGATLQFAGGVGPDGEPALFAFTSQEQVARMHEDDPAEVQSLVQPAAGALQLITSERYGWLYIDPAGPTCAISQRDASFALHSERNDAVKEALEIDDPDAAKLAVLDALAQNGPLLLAVDTATVPESGVSDGSPVGIRSSADPDGNPVLLAFTSGPEVSARNVEDSFAVRSTVDIIRESLTEPYTGLVINPNGPWIALDRAELESVLARIELFGSPAAN